MRTLLISLTDCVLQQLVACRLSHTLASSVCKQCVQPDPIYTPPPPEVRRHTVMLSTPLPTNQIKSCEFVLRYMNLHVLFVFHCL